MLIPFKNCKKYRVHETMSGNPRRSTALQIMPSVSLFKAAKNVDVWLLPIFECISHKAWSEISDKLEWAMSYILKNTSKSPQRKSKENITLDGIYERLNA